MQPLLCDLHPCVAEHQGTTDYPLKRCKPQRPHTGGTLHRCSHFTRKNARFRAPASSQAHNIHVAITMRFEASRTHPCSHYYAICIPALQNTRTTDYPLKRCKPQRPHTGGTLHRCSHFTRKNARFRAPASSPTHKSHATFM